jgi:GNAT superfamily N-acetyltransferase
MSGSGRFEIRKATIADEPLIAEAWQQAYGDMAAFKYPGRWRWNVLGNPFVEGGRRPLVWLAMDGRRVAAWTSAFVVPLHAGRRQVLGAHSVDTFTLPQYRRHGLGQLLQDENQRAHDVFIAIDPSPANRRNKYRVGGWPGHPLNTYVKLVGCLDYRALYASASEAVRNRMGPRAERIFAAIGRGGGAAALRGLFSLALRVRQANGRRRGPPPTAALELREVVEFGADSDRLWEEVAPSFSSAVRRDAAYLNWKYVQHPHQKYRKLLAWQGSRPVGAIIYRFPVEPAEQRAGLVSECFCVDDDPSIHVALFAHAESDFVARGLPLIRCGASTANQEWALGALGYQKADIDVPVVHVAPEAGGLDRSELLARDWLLSLGDSDLDQIRAVHQPTFAELIRILRGRIPGAENLPT